MTTATMCIMDLSGINKAMKILRIVLFAILVVLLWNVLSNQDGHPLVPPTPAVEPVEPDKPNVVLTDTAKGLLAASQTFPGAHVHESTLHPLLQKLATKQAQYQADIGVQGHQNFLERFEEVQRAGLGHAVEICAESWPWEKDEPYDKVGLSMFKAWSQSPGHWNVASKRHKWYGLEQKRSRAGTWYATILVAD